MRIFLVTVGLVLAVSLAIPQAFAQTPLSTYIGGQQLDRFSLEALQKLERSFPRATLQNMLTSQKTGPFLDCTLPRIADLADLPGMDALVKRFAQNGQGVAYEIAVAHAYRSAIGSVSGFLRGNELDGRLQSGTVIESKSAEPRRPEHLLVQLRRRAENGNKVILALGYRPSPEVLQKLRALSNELGGRIEVHHIPLRSSTYEVLVEGRNIENPCNRQVIAQAPRSMFALSTPSYNAGMAPKIVISSEVMSTGVGPKRARPERSWPSPALDRSQGSRSLDVRARSILRASTSRR